MWNYSIPGPGNKQVTFYNYGSPINRQGLNEVVENAYNDASRRHPASERINVYPLLYVQRGLGTRVALSFYPHPEVTWGDWANCVVGLEVFSMRWDNVALNFYLNIVGVSDESLGIGRVLNV